MADFRMVGQGVRRRMGAPMHVGLSPSTPMRPPSSSFGGAVSSRPTGAPMSKPSFSGISTRGSSMPASYKPVAYKHSYL